MTVGFVMLVHEPLDRARQVARHWAKAGCPIVIHVGKAVPRSVFNRFRADLGEFPDIRFCDRHRCEWGTFSLVSASQTAARHLLDGFPEVRHVFLASGACLPLRPVDDLRAFLDKHPRTDFIESVTTKDVPWTIGGLDNERFSFSFPFSWKRQRFLFDRYVRLQRALKRQRRIPAGITPHLGSQWWCLTRRTLTALFDDPRRAEFERYFRRVWIPDESYYQTLVRLYSEHVESRSLTLAKFDFQGKPHIFYDDHLQLLRRSDCFVARKVWPQAERLYSSFLSEGAGLAPRATPNPARIDQIFAKAVERRTRGRAGLYMQSRFPNWDWENGKTAAPYSIFCGFGEVFEDFPDWLPRVTDARMHGHLFAPDRVEFADNQKIFAGALTDSAALRDYNPTAFLTNLIWNTRGERQCFLFGPRDNQEITRLVASDPNAQISVISGSWAIRLFNSNMNFGDIRREAAKLQKIETLFLDTLRSPHTRARVRIWTMAEFLENPVEPLQILIEEIGIKGSRGLTELPRLTNLDGFGKFVQNLKNQGMHPYLLGDFPVVPETEPRPGPARRPFVVK